LAEKPEPWYGLFEKRNTRAQYGLPAFLASSFGLAPVSPLMQRSDLKRQIKELLVSELNLSGRDPSTIEDDAALFGSDGLGLDSLDALQIAMLVEEKFGVRVPEGVHRPSAGDDRGREGRQRSARVKG
jgi:acyl carrier protein